jgi:hypothetical protein
MGREHVRGQRGGGRRKDIGGRREEEGGGRTGTLQSRAILWELGDSFDKNFTIVV